MKITQKLKIMLRALILKAGEVETDKGRLIYDGEELTVGTEVFIENLDGEEVEILPAPDGEYKEGEKTYVVADGKISEIREPEQPAEEEEMAEDEPAAEPADDNDNNDSNEESLEDRVANLENRVAEILQGIENILNGVASLESRIEEIEGKLAKLEEPAADPAEQTDEQFSAQPKSRIEILREMNK